MKYNIGDKVKIIKYGHAIWRSEGINEYSSFPVICEGKDGFGSWIDIEPEIVGEIGIISKIEGTKTKRYAIEGIVKHAWYNEDQFELVESVDNAIQLLQKLYNAIKNNTGVYGDVESVMDEVEKFLNDK